MRWAISVLQWLVFYLSLLYLALASLIWNLIALVLYPFMGEERGRRIGRAGIAYGYRMYWTVAEAAGMMRLDVRALDELATEPDGLIVVANHPMLLDGVLVASRLPKGSCIMSPRLLNNVFIGAGARFARYISNEHPLGMIKKAVADIKRGAHLIIFPEGTRTFGRTVNPFKPGVTLIAKKAGCPIQTVFIETESPYLTKGWAIWRPPPLPIVINVRLGRRFPPADDHEKLLEDIEGYFMTHLKQAPASPAPALTASLQQAGRT